MTGTAAPVVVRAVSCPRCGGVPVPGAGPAGLARCGSCGILGKIDDPTGTPRIVFAPAVDASFALRALRARLEEQGEASAASLHACELVYVPVWRVTTFLAGRLAGERRRVERKLERRLLENGHAVYHWRDELRGSEHVERELQKRHVALCAACPLDEYGIPTLGPQRQLCEGFAAALPPERLPRPEPFHPSVRRGATVLDPIVGRDEAVAVADLLVERYRESVDRGLERTERLELVALGRDVRLVYSPVHLIRFGLADGLRGSAAVDAVTGRVISIRRPRSPAGPIALRLLSGAAAGGGWITGLLARLALLPPDWVPHGAGAAWTARLALLALAAGGATVAILRHLARHADDEDAP
ncbi:MAG: hypothetical protein D6718_06260 [Acidobacteria bacterium]|nr:MAG: hypothetical protein D6718_06260 [Acidobacteriota bacterium]